MTHAALDDLVRAVDAALDGAADEEAAIEAMRPAMARFLEQAEDALDPGQLTDRNGEAVGHLLHEDPGGRFHVISVVFPSGTSSGVHEHGCWGIIGYLRGLDEETRYRRVDDGGGPDGCRLEKVDQRVHEPGEISRLLPPDEMFHRVRNPGTEPGVSIHVLCMTPEAHPHRFWDRDAERLVPFPFRTFEGGIVRAEISPA